MKSVRVLVLATTFLATGAVVSPAQFVAPGSGLIAHIEGKVYLDDQRVEPSNTPAYILNPNSVVRTEEGRAEIRLAGEVSLFLGENAAVKRVPSGPYNFSRFELINGSTVVKTGEMGSVATCENQVTLSDFGLYRFDVVRPPGLSGERLCGFRVYEGAAAVPLATVISVATSGKFVSLSLPCGDRTPLQKFNIEETDDLDNWSRQRIRLRRGAE
jgi:hypothetical protein